MIGKDFTDPLKSHIGHNIKLKERTVFHGMKMHNIPIHTTIILVYCEDCEETILEVEETAEKGGSLKWIIPKKES